MKELQSDQCANGFKVINAKVLQSDPCESVFKEQYESDLEVLKSSCYKMMNVKALCCQVINVKVS